MNADVKQLNEELNAENDIEFQHLTIDFFDRLENKTTQLISNQSPDKHLKGRYKIFPFYFKEAAYIQSIEVTLEGYSSSDKVEFYWMSQLTGKPETSIQRVNGNKASIALNEVTSGFGFRPPKKYFKTPSIQKVDVTGLSLGNFSDACEKIGRFTTVKSKIIEKCNNAIAAVEEKEASITELNETNTTLSQTISEKNAEVEGLTLTLSNLGQQKAEAESSVEEIRSKESNLNVKIQNFEDSIDQKKNESSTLNYEIELKRTELNGLKRDINQFPAEISGFVKQGGTNIILYTMLAIIPIAIILFVSLAVFNGAVDLTVKYEDMPGMNLLTMLGSRLPFVFITIGILTVSYKLAKIFIAEIMRINRQRLNLSKVSIIAKDVSGSAVGGLDFDDDEKYELETKLKMDLLKSHLKSYVHDDYEQEISLGLFDRFTRQKEDPERFKENPKQSDENSPADEVEEE